MIMWPKRRRKPYTLRGIISRPCVRCGKPASQQWQVCSDGGNFRAVCKECDIQLNELVLKFMRHPRGRSLMKAYRERMSREDD